ncbi:XrtY-associated glycosyltransferase XYAG1 [uncultured Pedobacter sp.]|uniref:XrtY-associated glycosyltransferase XYAG1 n=1 Tax=uncultured Pedobacter sp. TaxID=246139 RepID=UPI0025F5112E|nr:glycosyltransferase [uncultured Pedobacter sp.]
MIHITASYKPAYIYGGPIQSVAKLVEALVSLRFRENGLCIDDVQVLTTTANGKKELAVKIGTPVLVDGVSVTYFKRQTKDHSHFSLGLLWALINTLRQAQDDKIVIHIHAWWNLVSILSCCVAKWYRIPVVLSPRGMLTSYTLGNRNSLSKKIIHDLLGKRLLRYCHIHSTSEQEKKDIIKIIKPKSITIIPNLVSLPFPVSGIHKSNNDKFRLLFLSRIEQKKGLEILFKALAIVNIPWLLTIAGAGTEEYVQSLKLKAEELKIHQQINWIGHVTNEDKFDLLARHDLTALTSYNENFANVIVESLSVGTPVLISKFVGLADYVAAKNLGWITGLKVEEIKTGILSAYEDIKQRKEIRTLAPLVVNADFKDDALAKQYVACYKKVLATQLL